MKPPAPPRVDSDWAPPGEPVSERCRYWEARIRAGWRPNRRIRTMGYEEAAAFFGVYNGEYVTVLAPLLRDPCPTTSAAG